MVRAVVVMVRRASDWRVFVGFRQTSDTRGNRRVVLVIPLFKHMIENTDYIIRQHMIQEGPMLPILVRFSVKIDENSDEKAL